jgi:nitroreductase
VTDVTSGSSGIDVRNADHLLSTTRAVRKRLDLDRPVSREVILECLRLATQAPTASNEQTWRWMVVTDADKRRAIADHYREGGRAYLESAATKASGQTRRVYESALYLTEILHRVPVHVIACVEGRFDGAPNLLAASSYGSILPAAWSFQLALRARGLGSVWTTLHLFREKEVAALLGIPETVTQVALFPVAYTTGGDFSPAKRPPVETVTYWDTWGVHPSA